SWWEDQLIAADVAGGMTIREALSSYASELYRRSQRSPSEQEMVQKQRMREFFRMVGKIDFQEPPLTDIYNELPIARHKGAMILELIEDQMGQEAVLSGIQTFLADHRYQSAPYATVIDLQNSLMAQAESNADKALIGELFNQVLTYQVGLGDVVYRDRADGRYDVVINVEAQKIQTTGLGEQSTHPVNLPITIELRDANNQLIQTFQPTINQEQSTITLVTDQVPSSATIDPRYRLPSAYLQDNTRVVHSGHQN
ncbi:MAG: peptidase, partial [Cyanobacteria bacterium J06631_9]